MDDDDGLTWDRNREHRERLWAKADAAPAAQPEPPPPAATPVLSLGERVAKRVALQLAKSGRAQARDTVRSLPEDDATLAEYDRPRTRGDCVDGPRPCPFVSCRHNVYLDVSVETGLIKVNVDREPWDLEHSCSLDLADQRGGMTLEEISEVLGITRERVRQLEAMGLRHLRLRRRRLA